ncbi:MAG TPA: energy transducer TonB [Opitutaceae bacterium]|nr:energy transducer TonB [Opitutaceae bacterium]
MNLRALLFLAASPLTLLAAEETAQAPQPAEESSPTLASLAKFEMPTFELVKLDQTPVVKTRVPPLYPSALRKANIEGEVLVDFVVTNEGKVVKAFAAKSSHREFEAAAVAAVSKWKFKPGTKGGRSVNTHMQVPIGFSLN